MICAGMGATTRCRKKVCQAGEGPCLCLIRAVASLRRHGCDNKVSLDMDCQAGEQHIEQRQGEVVVDDLGRQRRPLKGASDDVRHAAQATYPTAAVPRALQVIPACTGRGCAG